MYKKLYLLLLSLMAFSACDSAKQEAAKEQQAGATQTQQEVQPAKPAVLHANTQTRIFSNPEKQDTFKVYLTGESILKAQVTLEIISAEGKQLFQDTFPATDLIGFATDYNKTPQLQEEYIRKRVDEFFQNENFDQPAIAADDEFEEGYATREVWESIKSDKKAVGFSYLVGEEDIRFIAYARAADKVVQYYGCC
ncbi:hypothetical protein [Pontibacter ruber]|uniref:Lipoprotein n=1 Tax=Pontibacter ruber TaxID=1343895 RepID=A0ABW5CX58_9BACT|nr:hypothetical protein [Pontibacter ruber]